jgi:hypothetical protein
MASPGDIKVQGTPHADNQSAKAKDQNVPGPTFFWSFNPEKRAALAVGGLVNMVLHLLEQRVRVFGLGNHS